MELHCEIKRIGRIIGGIFDGFNFGNRPVGAGKSKALEILEDIGFYCVDHMPPVLSPNLPRCFFNPGKDRKVALVTDVRGGNFFNQLLDNLNALEGGGKNLFFPGYHYKILFLDANY